MSTASISSSLVSHRSFTICKLPRIAASIKRFRLRGGTVRVIEAFESSSNLTMAASALSPLTACDIAVSPFLSVASMGTKNFLHSLRRYLTICKWPSLHANMRAERPPLSSTLTFTAGVSARILTKSSSPVMIANRNAVLPQLS